MESHQLLREEMAQDYSLPVLPPDIMSLLKILNDDDAGYTELARELENFPSIVVKIVATANSAWASPVHPITTLRDSCARIGVQAVRSISIALSIAEVFDPARCPSFDSKLFWTSALLTAESAHLCAKDNPGVCADTARLAGLLHNMGLLWLATQKPLETDSVISLRQSNEIDSISAGLTEKLGINLYTAGSYLATYIDLPEVIAAAVASPATDASDDTPLINNHLNAQKLAASVLFLSDPENAGENESKVDDDPHFEQLSEKLPGIQALAQALFFS